jgi:hypothetical protein
MSKLLWIAEQGETPPVASFETDRSNHQGHLRFQSLSFAYRFRIADAQFPQRINRLCPARASDADDY